MAEETNPAVRGLRLFALLGRGEDLSGLDQPGDIGCHDRRPAAFQHLANQPACGFLLSLDRIPHAEGETSCFTDDAMYLLEAPPSFDERVAEARQDGVERAGGKSEGTGVHDLKADVPKPQGGGLVRGKPHDAFREVDPGDRARLAHCGGGFESDDPRAASDIENPFALFHMCELEQTSGDGFVIRRHVCVVLAGHAAVLLDQESRSLLRIQCWRMAPRLHCTFTDLSPASHLMHASNPQREWAARFRPIDCTSSRSSTTGWTIDARC